MSALKNILFIFIGVLCLQIQAQKNEVQTSSLKVSDSILINSNYFNPLSPSKAAFYSAIVPGLGQLYNKKYWKAPIVWGAMGASIYFYVNNNKEYNRYRTAFKLRENGLKDEFTNEDGSLLISRNGLISAQKTLKSNRDLSLLTTVIFYVLQIVEASVNAHLLQFNTNDNVSFSPTILSNYDQDIMPKVGLKFKLSF